MKAFAAALIAAVILYAVDAEYNDARYARVVANAQRLPLKSCSITASQKAAAGLISDGSYAFTLAGGRLPRLAQTLTCTD
jgi:hypothetical protein